MHKYCIARSLRENREVEYNVILKIQIQEVKEILYVNIYYLFCAIRMDKYHFKKKNVHKYGLYLCNLGNSCIQNITFEFFHQLVQLQAKLHIDVILKVKYL